MIVVQQVHAQAALAPVENYVVNRAIGGIIANRIAIARGVAANDAAWLSTAANDATYKATMAGISKSMTAANVASTALGVGLTIVGAPVWLTIAASLGVLAVGAAIFAGNTRIEVVSTALGNRLKVTQPEVTVNAPGYSTGAITIPSMQLGAQIYRDASCFSSESTCMYFPLKPDNIKFPYQWKPYPYDTGQWNKLWAVAYTFQQMKTYYLADLTGGNGTFPRIGPGGGNYSCFEDTSTTAACTLTRQVSWTVEPYWEFNSTGQPRLVAARQTFFFASPDNPTNSDYPATYTYGTAQAPLVLDGLLVDDSVKPVVKGTLDEVSTALNSLALGQQVSPQTMAQITDAAWRNAASQPDYQGLSYSASNPVTAQDVTTWAQANPDAVPKLSDLLVPATNPTTYPNGVPISHTIVYTAPTTPTTPTTPTGNQNVNVINTPNVNVVNKVSVDFGTDPGVADPTLEATPTGAQILQPLTSLFPEFRSFQTPAHASSCPKPAFDVFGKSVVMDSHCAIAEQHRAALAAVMMAVWLLVGLFILLSA
jgi:hypothetical protein